MAAPSRIIKVFCSPEQRTELTNAHELVEPYESFLLLRVSRSTARTLSRRYPVDDVTDQYQIRAGTTEINTSQARIDRAGRVRTHPAYRGVKRLARGKHHYLVQFAGPIKQGWLMRLKRLGAEPRSPFQDFVYVIRCTDAVLRKVAAERFVRWVGHFSHPARSEDSSTRPPATSGSGTRASTFTRWTGPATCCALGPRGLLSATCRR